MSIIYWTHLERSIQKERQEQAEWAGTVYQEYIDQVISETKEILEMLSLSSSVLYMDDKKTELLMKWIKDTDSRYAGVYWLNQDGVSISGTNKYFHHYSLIEQDDIELAVKTQKAVVIGTKDPYKPDFDYIPFLLPSWIMIKRRKGFYWHILGSMIWKKH
ncbi:hypothetical protein [Peribacillus sp. NJ4]|uniref:cache domain-containing protein n=1 Tax=Peribacillus sp. NJ4 TaxID=3055862 RepID=UPI0025A18475|nr:hypothetical protein [Peribacillus sp. NJ4]